MFYLWRCACIEIAAVFLGISDNADREGVAINHKPNQITSLKEHEMDTNFLGSMRNLFVGLWDLFLAMDVANCTERRYIRMRRA